MEGSEHGGKRAGQRVMSVSPQHIAAMVNIKTANLDREEAKKKCWTEMAARFHVSRPGRSTGGSGRAGA